MIPTFNHTREDSPVSPCKKCAALMDAPALREAIENIRNTIEHERAVANEACAELRKRDAEKSAPDAPPKPGAHAWKSAPIKWYCTIDDCHRRAIVACRGDGCTAEGCEGDEGRCAGHREDVPLEGTKPTTPAKCPAWADGAHLFAKFMGASMKVCACGVEVARAP